ncbi:ATP-binding protein [Xiamenia xianingshaonis]|uniref:ATP-binding protein n=1 Tax=Xiamenia xianingshaonis TaxID=2682776 RepID=A0A9E6MQG0_9ACTN|nr:ATP-binding protein [Xiamenia xianingshaonis]NHM13945.1 MarR family transcriptional regulator [Xiamenia xianingshaonis]QTU84371.1 ATP-binding protein [Xiamenia xianingshaonis]
MNEPETQHGASQHPADDAAPYDYTYVSSVARIACYDDLMSAPRITEIQPAPTADFINALSSAIYEQAHQWDSHIPYTVIREVAENYIHARFTEMIVSILDHGNTIRFADQGPGIPFKDRVQMPGFSSATEPMKRYIRGVGSGLPMVKEYLEFNHGTITIEDNLGTGAVVTIGFDREGAAGETQQQAEADARDALEREGQGSFADAQQQASQPAYQQVYPGAGGQDFVQPHYFAAQQVEQQAHPQQAQPFAGQQAYAPQQLGQPAAYPAQQAQPFAAQPQFAAQQQAFVQQQAAAGQLAAQQQFGQQAAAGQQFGQTPADPASNLQGIVADLAQREREVLPLFQPGDPLRVTDVVNLSGLSPSTISNVFTKLEKKGLLQRVGKDKREVTSLGAQVSSVLQSLPNQAQ